MTGGPPRPPTGRPGSIRPTLLAFTPHAELRVLRGGRRRMTGPAASGGPSVRRRGEAGVCGLCVLRLGRRAAGSRGGVVGSAAAELADRSAEEDRYAWRRPDWLEWDSARRVRPAVDGRGNAVEVWLVQVGLDELIRLVLESEPLLEEHD